MIKAIIFDFDGVLIDSTKRIFEIIKYFLPEFTEEQLNDVFKGNSHNNPLVKEFLKKHHDEFQQKFLDETKEEDFFSGTKELIEKLEHNYQLFINTSAPSYNVEKFLGLIDKENSFERIFGADIHTSKVEKFKMILNEHQLEKEECLFITDTLGDLRESYEVQIKSIGITWGVHKRDTLEQGESVAIIDNFVELLEVIRRYK